MQYWLMKTEPGDYSFDDLIKDGQTLWDGVRNYAARNNMRLMKKGDLVLFYHSVKQKEIVGVCKVVTEHYPDPTAIKGDWSVVDVVPVKPFKKFVHLHEVKAREELQQIALVRNSRLSVMPLEESEFMLLLEMGETKL